ncbi:MAG: tetratricopeptide repeat protein [Myxococcales bacterium]|nr:tetratricopeptide repeat protein [Myxococcales bacterium]
MKRFAPFLLALWIIGLSASARAESLVDLYFKARDARRRGDCTLALRLYARALRLATPSQAAEIQRSIDHCRAVLFRSNLQRGNVARKKGRCKLAERLYRQALRYAPRVEQPNVQRLVASCPTKGPEKQPTPPKRPDATLYERAYYAVINGKCNEAAMFWGKALENDRRFRIATPEARKAEVQRYRQLCLRRRKRDPTKPAEHDRLEYDFLLRKMRGARKRKDCAAIRRIAASLLPIAPENQIAIIRNWAACGDRRGCIPRSLGDVDSVHQRVVAARLPDGGYVVAVAQRSQDKSQEIRVLRLDADGAIRQSVSFGGRKDDWPLAIARRPDGGLLVVGNTTSFGASVTTPVVLRLSRTLAIEGYNLLSERTPFSTVHSLRPTARGFELLVEVQGVGFWRHTLGKSGALLDSHKIDVALKGLSHLHLKHSASGLLFVGGSQISTHANDGATLFRGYVFRRRRFDALPLARSRVMLVLDGELAELRLPPVKSTGRGKMVALRVEQLGRRTSVPRAAFGSRLFRASDGGFLLLVDNVRPAKGLRTDRFEIVRLNAQLKTIWRTTLNGMWRDRIDVVLETKNGGWMILGTRDRAPRQLQALCFDNRGRPICHRPTK